MRRLATLAFGVSIILTYPVVSLANPSTAIWHPTADKPIPWQWQLQGKVEPSKNPNIDMVDIDLFDSSASLIQAFHQKNVKVICYFSAGSWENWRSDHNEFPKAVLGDKMEGWDERWLDIRIPPKTEAKRYQNWLSLKAIMEARLDLAAKKQCDGVEPDNVDGYSNKTGFPITADDQLAYNRFLADAAHTRDLSVGLKNDVDQAKALVNDFDWALNEQCHQYNECDHLKIFSEPTPQGHNKAVFWVEYKKKYTLKEMCPIQEKLHFNFLKKHLNLKYYFERCPNQKSWSSQQHSR